MRSRTPLIVVSGLGDDHIAMIGRLSKILVVDDEPHGRSAIARLLRLDFPHAVIAEADDARKALRMIAAERWDLVLLDVSMPGMSGFEALRDLRSRNVLVPVVLVSVLPAAQYEAAAVAAGAFAYIQKDRLPRDLDGVVRSLLSETRVVSGP